MKNKAATKNVAIRTMFILPDDISAYSDKYLVRFLHELSNAVNIHYENAGTLFESEAWEWRYAADQCFSRSRDALLLYTNTSTCGRMLANRIYQVTKDEGLLHAVASFCFGFLRKVYGFYRNGDVIGTAGECDWETLMQNREFMRLEEMYSSMPAYRWVMDGLSYWPRIQHGSVQATLTELAVAFLSRMYPAVRSLRSVTSIAV